MLYLVTIGLAAFLVFAIQPIAARIILPWFGGSAAVWSTSLLFFQGALLIGYLYADWLDRRLTPRRQARTHLLLLAISLALLPIVPLFDWKPSPTADPALSILMLLACTIGLPYTLLATTAPLLQSWYRRSHRDRALYRLYAISNAGSMLGLLTYPVLVEPFLSRRTQAISWISGYLLFAVLCGILGLRQRRLEPETVGGDALEGGPAPGGTMRMQWIVWSAYPSAMLVAITSYLTQNVAPVPMLWIVPLALYLLSFILCFGVERTYWRWIWLPLAALALGGMAELLYGDFETPSLMVTVSVFTAALFVCCMVCHGELVRTKPHPRHLTTFYLALSAGGVIGSSLAGFVAPRVLSGLYELPIAVAIGPVLVAYAIHRGLSEGGRRRTWRIALLLPAMVFSAALAVFIGRGIRDNAKDARLAVRNFYGALRVFDQQASDGSEYRELLHGTIAHGAQWLDPARRCEPITYYGPESGIGTYLANPQRPEHARVAVMGLGAGTITSLGRAGDHFSFYEINPLVPQLDRSEFSFLDTCGPRVDVVMGDARLSLEREPDAEFDLIVMDAFSGDSIPVHLITKEAFELYFRLLKPSGVIAVHISNRYVDLEPVLDRVAQALGKDLLLVDDPGDDNLLYGSSWGLLSAPSGVLADPEISQDAEDIERSTDASLLWTDEYSSLWRVLKWRK